MPYQLSKQRHSLRYDLKDGVPPARVRNKIGERRSVRAGIRCIENTHNISDLPAGSGMQNAAPLSSGSEQGTDSLPVNNRPVDNAQGPSLGLARNRLGFSAARSALLSPLSYRPARRMATASQSYKRERLDTERSRSTLEAQRRSRRTGHLRPRLDLVTGPLVDVDSISAVRLPPGRNALVPTCPASSGTHERDETRRDGGPA